MKKDKFKANLYYVNWVLIDDKKMIPYIDNKGFTKIKNILTGEIAPRQLLLDKVNGRNTDKYVLDNDFARQIADANSADLFSLAPLEEYNRNIVKAHLSFLDICTDKIARNIYYDQFYNKEYTTEQYAHFTNCLQNAMGKYNKQCKIAQQRDDDFNNQFNF